ncbi:MAG: peptidoglycan DD-metalloendopeptidase family protein [Candidatus Omnitrophica bacterium]|nr:peptidoglycan DD-metalloendopeptidase family protein [Candidatus Omnitrophota bacterium]
MKRLYLSLLLVIFLSGCATVAYHPTDIGRTSTPGIYHEVERGQTLWNISRIYNVDLEKIIRANRLPDASKIEVGQLVFVPEIRDPGRKKVYVKSSKSENFIWPVKGIIVSYFGSMNNMVKNKGLNIQARDGSNVVASLSGRVTFASDHMKGYGKTIIIDHPGGLQTVYAYNKQNLVNPDQRVKQGEVIAKVGKTGRAQKPTLHFEIRKNHKPQNPFYYLP